MITIGVLALQGAFAEHLAHLQQASQHLSDPALFTFTAVRSAADLSRVSALVIPGGESTTMSLVASRLGLLEPLRRFVGADRRPTWGTCAGLILLAREANATKAGGQDLVGGLDVRVRRNHFGRQMQSFETALDLPFLGGGDGRPPAPFPAVFIRAPVVEAVLPPAEGDERGEVEVMAALRREGDEGELVVAVRQGHIFGTSFHPELTDDVRLHVWWLKQVEELLARRGEA